MEHYILIFNHDDTSLSASYWDGTSSTTDLNKATLLPDLVTARQTAGGLQSQYTDRQVTPQKVIVSVTMAPYVT